MDITYNSVSFKHQPESNMIYVASVSSRNGPGEEFILRASKVSSDLDIVQEWESSQVSAYEQYHKQAHSFEEVHHKEVFIIIYKLRSCPGDVACTILKETHKKFETPKVINKQYINGPKKNKEFLDKVGKKYAHN